MGIQVTIPKEQVPFGVDVPQGYVRIRQTLIDWEQKNLQFTAAIWTNKAASDAGKQPILSLPPVTIMKDAQPPRFQPKADGNGNISLDADGKPEFIQLSTAVPGFNDVLQQLVEVLAQGDDYRKMGYELFKKLDMIKNHSPVDVYE